MGYLVWLKFRLLRFCFMDPVSSGEQGLCFGKSFEFTLIMCLAQLPGYFSAAYLVERVGRKMVLAVYFAGTAVASWLFGHAGSTNEVLLYGSLLYFFSLGAWGCVYAYTPEVYPTVARASGSGWAAAFGRLVLYGLLLYRLFIMLMDSSRFYLCFYFAYRSICTGVFGCGDSGKETMGKSLEEISSGV